MPTILHVWTAIRIDVVLLYCICFEYSPNAFISILRIIGKKWTVLIIREMIRGTMQFNRFLERIEGITPKVLTERLRELQKFGIVKRRIVSEYPIRVEYEMTDLEKEFEPVLLAAASFSMRNMPKIVFIDGRPRNPAD